MPPINNAHLTVSFQGGAARDHRIRLRQLGESLIGIERIISSGLFYIETGQFPRRGQRFPYTIQTSGPRRGSVELEILALLQENAVLMPLFQELYLNRAKDLIWNFVNGVMYWLGGRRTEGELFLQMFTEGTQALVEMRRMEHAEKMALINLAASARNVVSPVGRSCEKIVLTDGEGKASQIDSPMADVIRSTRDLEVSEMYQERIQVDGFTHHNRQLKVIHPREPHRFITAKVQDPEFTDSPNLYTEAAARKGFLKVTAKDSLRQDGRIHIMYIMDASPDNETTLLP